MAGNLRMCKMVAQHAAGTCCACACMVYLNAVSMDSSFTASLIDSGIDKAAVKLLINQRNILYPYIQL